MCSSSREKVYAAVLSEATPQGSSILAAPSTRALAVACATTVPILQLLLPTAKALARIEREDGPINGASSSDIDNSISSSTAALFSLAKAPAMGEQ